MHDLKNLNLDTLTIKAKQWGTLGVCSILRQTPNPFRDLLHRNFWA